MGITAKLDRKKCKIRILAFALRKLPFHKGTSLPWIIDIVAVVSTKNPYILHIMEKNWWRMPSASSLDMFFFFLNGKKILHIVKFSALFTFPGNDTNEIWNLPSVVVDIFIVRRSTICFISLYLKKVTDVLRFIVFKQPAASLGAHYHSTLICMNWSQEMFFLTSNSSQQWSN